MTDSKRRSGRRGSITEADRRFLLDSQKRLTRTLARLASGRTGRMLDDEFDDFDLPLVAKRRRQPSSPSGVVLASDTVIIKASDLGRYEAAISVVRMHSRELRDLDLLMGRCNQRIQRILGLTGIIYRGMGIAELEIIARHGGAFGLHPRKMYAAVNDFVSFSIDASDASQYAMGKRQLGLLVEADVSGMDRSAYATVPYGARNDISVTRGGRRTYNPYEKFGGSQSGTTLSEAEVHLKVGSRPRVRTVIVLGDRPASFKRRLERAVAVLERAQGRKITIKYVHEVVFSW